MVLRLPRHLLHRPLAAGFLLLFASVLNLAAPVAADLPLVADDEIPEQLTRVDGDGIHVFTRIGLDEHHFDGFSLGGSDDLPAGEAARLRGLVSALGPDQWLFVQATADTTRWRGYRKKDNHRLDVSVAIARALWGLDALERRRVTTLPPRLAAMGRGLKVYVATYDERVIPFPFPEPPVAPVAAPAVVMVEEAKPFALAIGLEGGVGILRTAGLTMTTPTVDLVIEKENARLDAGVGWWPSGDNEFGDLAVGAAKATVTWFPRGGPIGPFVGWVGASQFVRSVTEYVVFAHGPAFGATLRGHYWLLDTALRVGYARVNLDELDQDQDWTHALVLSLQAGKVF